MTTPMVEEAYSLKGIPLRYKVAGALSLPLALLLVHLPFWVVIGTVRLCALAHKVHVSVEEAEIAAKVVRQFARRYYFGRAACLEVSLGAYLTCSFLRRHVDWRIGACFNPVAIHAWIEVDGEPVLEQFENRPYQAFDLSK